VARVGAQEGIHFDFERVARTPNTVRSHRLLYAAAEEGKQSELLDLIFAAYFTQGLDIGDADVLSALAFEAGMSGGLIADALTEGSRLDVAITEDLQSRRIGINGVPFFVFNGRFGLSGAQEPEALLNMLDLAREEGHAAQHDGRRLSRHRDQVLHQLLDPVSCGDFSCAQSWR
jgi:predicted DsbA family dithiol-disulfide isomerase